MQNIKILKTTTGYNVSDRYNVINSMDVIQRFEKYGFELDSVEAAGVRSMEKAFHQKHMIRLSAPVNNLTGLKQQVVIYNSYDASASLKIHVGYFRFVCANSIVAGSHTAPVLAINHSNSSWEEMVDMFIDNYEISYKKQEETIDLMHQRQMTIDEAIDYAEKALAVRHYDNRITNDWVDPLEVLIAQRKEDRGNTMFHKFQVMQENIVNGYFRKYGNDGSIKKAKIMTNIDEILRFNTELSTMFEDELYK